jgi:hypothetical protein
VLASDLFAIGLSCKQSPGRRHRLSTSASIDGKHRRRHHRHLRR